MTDDLTKLLPPEVLMVFRHQSEFTDEFMDFIPANVHIYRAFEAEAMEIARRGFTHYSARTILEVLRHHSNLRENGDEAAWKLNNDVTPYLARLFALMNPAHAKLFSYRATPKTEVQCA